MDKKILVFGYGSLIDTEGWNLTLKRDIQKKDLKYTIVNNYVRTWTAMSKVFFSDSKDAQIALFLDLTKSSNLKTNGYSLEVSKSEFQKIRKREKSYEMIDITSSVENPLENSIYYAAIVNSDKKCTDFSKAFIPQKYYNFVENAVNKSFDEIQKKFFIDNTIQNKKLQFKNKNYKFFDNEINENTSDY